MKPQIGITDKYLNQINVLLTLNLSNAMAVYIKSKKAHWNVSGESFMELHKLFEDHYTQLEESIDKTAERIVKLGGQAIGTMGEFLKYSSIKEYPGKYPSAIDTIKELLKDHETIIIQLRKDIAICADKDIATADFLTGLIEKHETIAWTLRRYLS